MVNYYTLEEAARLLGLTPDELRKMAERNEIRAFRDRGNLRFRNQDIEERARQLGRGSDPDLQPRAGDSPPPKQGGSQVFDFEIAADEGDVDLGSLARSEQPSSKKSGRSSKLGPRSPGPVKKTGSDSDVRLVPDGSNVDFVISSDSDVKMVQEPPPPKSQAQRKSSGPQEDSGVRIVPLDGDSDVRIQPDEEDSGVLLGSSGPRSASDSDIRLHEEPSSGHSDSRKRKGEPPITEEIDLDAELGKASPGPQPPAPRKSKMKAPPPNLPTSSPFELSDTNLPGGPKSGVKKEKTDTSSDFDLTPMSAKDQSPLAMDADEVGLGELRGGKAGDSGINLRDPADSGISLEQGASDDDMEMELSLDSSKTPPPAKKSEVPSSDEFELSLDSGKTPDPRSGKGGAAVDDSDSEFELTLDAEGGTPPPASQADSDSEFELTLDAEGGLAPLEEEEATEEERDIFETDFEVPALDEESGSQAVALDESDTELESEDFDLALGEGDVEGEDESHSQVVAIEEEEEERPRRQRRGEEEIEEEEEPAGRAVAAAPAPWGVLPALVMFPCVLVMFLVGLMAFEMLHGMWGYHQNTKVGSLIIRPMAETFSGEDLPK
jgi:excisionase family DNA binding protein